MPNPANESVRYPFTSFNFSVEIDVPGVSPKVCSAAFSECDGLEMNMEVKTIREGGNNGRQLRLAGPMTFGMVTLKRGMTATFDLWDWFSAVLTNARLRATASVVLLAADGQTERARFQLTGCLPVKLKAPPLNAKDGMVAIEEFQMAYESLTLKRPTGGLGLGVSADVSVGLSASASIGVNASAGVSLSGSAEISIG
jgi:phage tail-like protein